MAWPIYPILEFYILIAIIIMPYLVHFSAIFMFALFALPNVCFGRCIASHLWKSREYSIPTQSSAQGCRVPFGLPWNPLESLWNPLKSLGIPIPKGSSCKVGHTKVLPRMSLRNKEMSNLLNLLNNSLQKYKPAFAYI